MRIGIVCFPSPGGSGVVAAELGRELARRGHTVHFIANARPFRLPDGERNIHFHAAEAPAYPLFQEPPHALSLANTLVQVSREAGLDVIHVHYAVPHAAAAVLARQALGRWAPALVSTIHGSDVTVVGSHPSLAEITAYCLNASDEVTAPSDYLRGEARRRFDLQGPVTVIPNFVNPTVFWPRHDADHRRRYAADDDRLVIHISNFRPVKRVPEVVRIFAMIAARVPARLLLVGDGPELDCARAEAATLGVGGRVTFLGRQTDVAGLLGLADLFLFPSLNESFGVAAAEAMACGVPVVASDVDGLRELIRDGETGFLRHPQDREGMAERGVALLSDPERHRRMSRAACRHIHTQFTPGRIVPLYENAYRRAMEVRAARGTDGGSATESGRRGSGCGL